MEEMRLATMQLAAALKCTGSTDSAIALRIAAWHSAIMPSACHLVVHAGAVLIVWRAGITTSWCTTWMTGPSSTTGTGHGWVSDICKSLTVGNIGVCLPALRETQHSHK
jgi:hypothetical protein